MQKSKKHKTDYEALHSPFMKIPYMDIEVARSLIDLGLNDIFDLRGRCPEIIYQEAIKKNNNINEYSIRYFRLAVYYADNINNLCVSKIHPQSWK